MNLTNRRPAVMRPVAVPDTYESRIAELQAEVTRLEGICASKERTIVQLDRRVTELCDSLAAERLAHQASISQRRSVTVSPDAEVLRQFNQERRNNIVLSDQLAEAQDKNALVRLGGWPR